MTRIEDPMEPMHNAPTVSWDSDARGTSPSTPAAGSAGCAGSGSSPSAVGPVTSGPLLVLARVAWLILLILTTALWLELLLGYVVLTTSYMIPALFVTLALSRGSWHGVDRFLHIVAVYGGITVVLGGIALMFFVAVVAGMSSLLGQGHESWAALAAAVLVAATFRPAQVRVQRFVDTRLFKIHIDFRRMHRSAVYSLGVVAYRMICGQPPFVRTDDLGLVLAHLHHPPDDPRTYVPDLPGKVSRVLLKVLEKDPAGRYPTARGLRHRAAPGGRRDPRRCTRPARRRMMVQRGGTSCHHVDCGCCVCCSLPCCWACGAATTRPMTTPETTTM